MQQIQELMYWNTESTGYLQFADKGLSKCRSCRPQQHRDEHLSVIRYHGLLARIDTKQQLALRREGKDCRAGAYHDVVPVDKRVFVQTEIMHN